MHLFGLTITQFASLLAAGVAVVAALYALKSRRRTVVVSFAPLWEQVTADARRTSLFQRLRRILSFLLQVAFVTLVLLALASPRWGGGAERERRFVVVVDCGASMQARLDAAADRTRFDEAKSLARAFVSGLSAGDAVALVTPGAPDGFVRPFERDASRLLDALDKLRAGDGPSDVDAAERFAVSLAGRTDRVVMLTDRPVAASSGVDRRQVGGPLDNVAITRFAARPLSESPGEYELFFEVANFGRAPADVRLTISTAGDKPAVLDERALSLAPGARASDVLRGLVGDDLRLLARLAGPDGRPRRDGLALDDAAEADVRAPRVVKVLVVGAGDFFLDAALASDPFVAASRVAPADYAGPGDSDLVIFDGADASVGAPARAIVIRPPSADAPKLKDVFVDRIDAEHPVMRWVGRLSDLNIARARALAPEPGDVVLASSAGTPVMLARERGGSRLVEIGFDLRESDLPLRVAFPKIVRNAVRWVTGNGDRHLNDVTVPVTISRDAVSDLFATPEAAEPRAAGPAASRADTGWELWPALAAVALALTAFEWLSYHRRWTV